ncbi:MAG: hypothetical protein ACR2O1_13080 [Boseongicola sp.]
MDDFTRLEQKLAKLRQRERASGEKRIVRGTTDKLLAAIIAEVDETILPRRLSFARADGAELHFAVANRRLQALLAPAPATEGAAQLADKAIRDAEDPNLAALHTVVLATLNSSDELTITTRRQSGGGFPSDVGVPVGQVARAWNIPESADDAATHDTMLKDFIEALGDRVLAWLRIDGEEVADQAGETALLGKIGEHAAVFLDGYFAKRDQLFQGEDGPVALVLSSGGAAPSLVFLDVGSAMAFLAVNADSSAGVARDWQLQALS